MACSNSDSAGPIARLGVRRTRTTASMSESRISGLAWGILTDVDAISACCIQRLKAHHLLSLMPRPEACPDTELTSANEQPHSSQRRAWVGYPRMAFEK